MAAKPVRLFTNDAGDAGNAGTGKGGNAASIGTGGSGGKGGSLSISTTTGNIFVNIDANGGNALNQLFIIGLGGKNPLNLGAGGNSGSVGKLGSGGPGGTVTLNSSAGGTLRSAISANGGGGAGTDGGSSIASAGAGNIGGKGGSIGNAGSGGAGGKITLTGGSFTAASLIDISAFGGTGGSYFVDAGDGGDGTVTGGNGGALGNAGNGGKGGNLTITLKNSGVDMTNAAIATQGGTGGSQLGASGTGGQNGLNPSSSNGGLGGNVGTVGSGGSGGKVVINGPGTVVSSTLTVGNITARGGDTGLFAGALGNGGNGTNLGGAGGKFAGTGNAGAGGSITINSTKTDITQEGNWVAAGGSVFSPSNSPGGNGGSGLIPGIGGSIGVTGNAGAGGKVTVQSSNSLKTTIDRAINVAGGDMLASTVIAGNGGDGIGATAQAAAGGSIGNFGKAGLGGTVLVNATNGIQFTADSNVNARGGQQVGILIVNGGAGGDSSVSGFNGGSGGNIGNGPSTGQGGKITINTGTGVGGASDIPTLAANGGNSDFFAGISGAGGNGRLDGKGGNSGKVGSAGKSGSGGSIIVTSTTGTIRNKTGLGILLDASGGGGASFTVVSPTAGDGGTAGNLKSIGGSSGSVGSNGNAGAGGSITLKSTSAAIRIGTNASGTVINANGGAVGIMNASSGNAGNGSATGGKSGTVGNAGNAGNAGSITITTSGDLGGGIFSATGGDQAIFASQSGTGGNAKSSGAGGGSGNVGKGGNAGNGGKITLTYGNFGGLQLGGLLAFGGGFQATADFTGQSGKAGSGTGSGAGGNAGTVGSAGNAGAGGKIAVTVKSGSFLLSAANSDALIDVSGGAGLGDYLAIGGAGGGSAATGGKGGLVGASSQGGKGGTIAITATQQILIESTSGGTQNVSVLANGGSGALNGGTGGAGGCTGCKAGGAGGSVGVAGKAGSAGVITLTSSGSNVTIAGSGTQIIAANGGVGGFAAAQGGNGGVGSTTGKGGNVGAAGNGGNGGKITISTPNVIPLLTIANSANFGAGGTQTGTAGNPGGTKGAAGTAGTAGTIISMERWDDSDNDIITFKKKVKQWKRHIASAGGKLKLEVATSRTVSTQVPGSAGFQPASASNVHAELSETFDDLSSVDENEFGPVAFVQSIAPVMVLKSGSAGYQPASDLPNSQFYAPERQSLNLKLPCGDLSIAPGARVLVQVKDDCVAVFNLHDRRAGQVTIRSQGKVITPVMGQAIIISSNCSADLAKVNPAPEISLRDLKSNVLGNQKVFTADFSIMSALMNHSALKNLQASGNAENKKHFQQLLKNAIVLNYVTAKHGNYKSH